MTAQIKIAPVQKSILVKAPLETAFEVFTAGLTRWWPANTGLGRKPIEKVLLEPRLGGRWIEIAENGAQTIVATISVWEPPTRLVMLWHMTGQFKADTSVRSEVDVRFSSEGPNATRVELVHGKFENLGSVDGEIVRGAVDGGWPGMLDRFAKEAERSIDDKTPSHRSSP